jgi:hypothetical protein
MVYDVYRTDLRFPPIAAGAEIKQTVRNSPHRGRRALGSDDDPFRESRAEDFPPGPTLGFNDSEVQNRHGNTPLRRIDSYRPAPLSLLVQSWTTGSRGVVPVAHTPVFSSFPRFRVERLEQAAHSGATYPCFRPNRELNSLFGQKNSLFARVGNFGGTASNHPGPLTSPRPASCGPSPPALPGRRACRADERPDRAGHAS